MLKSLKLAALLSVAVAWSALAGGDKLGLGRVATADEVTAWNTDIRPDGVGLPEGRGDVLTGEEIFADTCAMCHGDFGEGVDRWPVLAGGMDTLTDDRPVKTIGSFWPYLSTVFDYVTRAMPFGNSGTLEPDEVYAITAYLLYVNDLVDADFELSHENFTEVELPNVDNFYLDDRAQTELVSFVGEPCMTDCKASVEITAHAAVIDVTPDLDEEAEAEVVAPEPVETAEMLDPEQSRPVKNCSRNAKPAIKSAKAPETKRVRY